MARPDKISRFLPLTFANGNSVRRFGKHCPQCRAMVGAEHMEGIASLKQGKIFLSAEACCPQCRQRFPVACVITDDKRVHRVLLPLWMFRIWLNSATRHDPQPENQDNWEIEAEEPKGLSLPADAEVVRSEEVLGRFQGEPICAWIEYQGQRFVFDRAAPGNNLTLTPSELLFEGRLIYRQQ
ncbi:hypothetical protein KIF53_18215 [Chromobacterium subtsugae]|uniref:Uncharacterized protein n=1 Tax=Chromobacterium subtsugae TaxID=251747 RepID=A0ABS7FHM6_9NEIS|nr:MULTISPECIES: hypothetical protein [Chromobacterium]KUM02249.1 hypothetical protein Cv017_03780 [Chromobacterium subtsugae]KZE86204.1 hypothetical protein AWB61_16845 [Chromobacterium sp. F49]MBW7568051.1 hypothetical protein [Chromobacterium subtsugae]MBW8289575.1 hypothetical protein [Chromobacterium subtsugae]OBU86263.1 hypothetical protein MY55_11370 [Chromobacterium subtsugae]